MKKKINIQSISDIITNSSSEVFTIYSEDSIQAVKELVDSILKLAGDKKRFDDYFTIELGIDEYYLDDVKDEHPEVSEYAELRRIIIDEYNECISHGEAGYGVKGLVVTPKDPKSERAAKLLEQIDNMFETRELYC